MKNKNDFEFNYVAPTAEERKEIESIKNSYVKTEKSFSKLETLRKLDAKVKRFPKVLGIIIGIFGLLVFGLGMTMVLEWQLHLWGVLVGIVGIIIMLFTNLIYKLIKNKLKSKYGKTIIELSDELLNQ